MHLHQIMLMKRPQLRPIRYSDHDSHLFDHRSSLVPCHQIQLSVVWLKQHRTTSIQWWTRWRCRTALSEKCWRKLLQKQVLKILSRMHRPMAYDEMHRNSMSIPLCQQNIAAVVLNVYQPGRRLPVYESWWESMAKIHRWIWKKNTIIPLL